MAKAIELADLYLREHLGMSLEAFLREHRRNDKSWEEISRVLLLRANITTSARTVSRWGAELGVDEPPAGEGVDDPDGEAA